MDQLSGPSIKPVYAGRWTCMTCGRRFSRLLAVDEQAFSAMLDAHLRRHELDEQWARVDALIERQEADRG